MNITFQMPSWKTGIQKRLARLSYEQVRDFVILLVVMVGLILMLASPIVLAFYTPPTLDYISW